MAYYSIVIILGLIILNVITEIHKHVINPVVIQRIDSDVLLGYFCISLLSVLFGVLIESRRFLTIFTGSLKVNWLIIPSLILLVISLLPHTYTFYYIGISSYRHFPHGILFAPLQNTHTLIMLGILTGVLLVRSLVKDR